MVVKQEIVSAEEEEDTQTPTTEDDVNEVIPENDVDQDEVSQEEDVPQEQKQGRKRRRDTISNLLLPCWLQNKKWCISPRQ